MACYLYWQQFIHWLGSRNKQVPARHPYSTFEYKEILQQNILQNFTMIRSGRQSMKTHEVKMRHLAAKPCDVHAPVLPKRHTPLYWKHCNNFSNLRMACEFFNMSSIMSQATSQPWGVHHFLMSQFIIYQLYIYFVNILQHILLCWIRHWKSVCIDHCPKIITSQDLHHVPNVQHLVTWEWFNIFQNFYFQTPNIFDSPAHPFLWILQVGQKYNLNDKILAFHSGSGTKVVSNSTYLG